MPVSSDFTNSSLKVEQYPDPHRRLSHVKQAKVANLPDLIAIVEAALPDFEIPVHLRPAA